MIDTKKLKDAVEGLEYMIPEMARLRKKMLTELMLQGFTRQESMEIIKFSAASTQ